MCSRDCEAFALGVSLALISDTLFAGFTFVAQTLFVGLASTQASPCCQERYCLVICLNLPFANFAVMVCGTWSTTERRVTLLADA
jgi:hypothetical protein